MRRPIEFYLPIRTVPKHDGDEKGRNRARRDRVMLNAKAIRQLFVGFRYAPHEPWSCAVRLDVWFIVEMTKGMQAQGLGEVYGDLLPHFERAPDMGNLHKQVADALQGIAYQDDKQVCAGVHLMTWGDEYAIKGRISELAHGDVRRLWTSTAPRGTLRA